MSALPDNAITNAMLKAVPERFAYNWPIYPRITGKLAAKPAPIIINAARAKE